MKWWDEFMTYWPIALVGLAIMAVAAFVLFALWIEGYVRRYGEAGGTPNERPGHVSAWSKP